MHFHVLGYPVAVAVVLGAAAFALHVYKPPPGRWADRLAMLSNWLIFFAVFCATIGISPWLDALAGLVGKGPGVVILLVLFVLGGVGFAAEVLIGHMRHPIRSSAIAGVFAVVLALSIGESAMLLSRAAKSPGKTVSALGTAMGRIKSGQAAAAVAPHQRIVILVIGMLVFAAFIYVRHHFGMRLKGTARIARKRGGGSKAGQQALTPGQQANQQAALTAGRRP